MSAPRLVVPAESGRPSSAAGAAPSLESIAIAFGVGRTREAIPGDDDFRTTYHVQMPSFSLGGLDPDGVYELDAGAWLHTLQSRAQRRRWGVRLELTLSQTQADVGAGDLVVTSPTGASAPMRVVGSPRGTTTAGGGRSIVVASPIVADPSAMASLSGAYVIGIGDGPSRTVTVHLGRFEFEG